MVQELITTKIVPPPPVDPVYDARDTFLVPVHTLIGTCGWITYLYELNIWPHFEIYSVTYF